MQIKHPLEILRPNETIAVILLLPRYTSTVKNHILHISLYIQIRFYVYSLDVMCVYIGDIYSTLKILSRTLIEITFKKKKKRKEKGFTVR